MENFLPVVVDAKLDLEKAGVDLSGPCGAFQITKLVAWRLRDKGIKLLKKESGNNCDGYSVDYLVREDLTGVDMLSDAGGDNGPVWNEKEADPGFAGRIMEPIEVNDPDAPVPVPLPDHVDSTTVIAIHEMNAHIEEISRSEITQNEKLDALMAKLEHYDREFEKIKPQLAALLPVLIGGGESKTANLSSILSLFTKG